MDKLSKHRAGLVRWRVACNPSTSTETLERLSKERDKPEPGEGDVFYSRAFIRGGVALNKKLPDYLMERLSRDTSSLVRQNLATNPSVSCEVLDMLRRDRDEYVMEAARREFNSRCSEVIPQRDSTLNF